MGRTKAKIRTRSTITILAALSLVGSLAAPSAAYPRPGQTILQYVGQEQTPMSNHRAYSFSDDFSLSHNGRFLAFESAATNLITPDLNPGFDVFVFDRQKRKTELISKASDGTQGIGRCAFPSNPTNPIAQSEEGSNIPAISASGRYIAFASCATNLVPDDDNLREDIFVHDRATGTTRRVSVSSAGDQTNTSSSYPTISSDGRYVAFTSDADNLVAGDSNDVPDVFLHDLKKRTTRRISVTSRGKQASGASYVPSLSDKARFIAFQSFATDLIDEDTNGMDDIFVHDRLNGKTELVSLTSKGALRNDPSDRRALYLFRESISADGRTVLFASSSSGMVPNDSNGITDLFIHDRRTDRTERVTVTRFGGELAEAGTSVLGQGLVDGALSSGGRFVAFTTGATNLALEDEERPTSAPLRGDQDVFIHDRSSGAVDIASASDGGEDARCTSLSTGDSFGPAFSGNGRHIAFISCGVNLDRNDPRDPTDFSKMWQIFVRDQGDELAIGGFGGSPSEQEPPDDRICVTPDLCIPPGAAVSSSDDVGEVDEVLTEQGANLYGASLAYRPNLKDLFVKIELEHMPKVIPSISPIFYGLRFRLEDQSYEVRATSLNYGTFGLFDCTEFPTCTKVSDLRGGYGTTGMRIVFSLPLEEIGLEDGGELKDVVAFSGLGSYLSGASKVLDALTIK